jgi:Tfp pilus assembly protein PilE
MANLTQKILIGLAFAGLLGIFVVGVLVGSAVIGWKAALRAGNEAATMQDLKTIAAVEIQYYNTHHRTFGTFDQMVGERMLAAKFSGTSPPMADGYVFNLNVIPGTPSNPSSYRLNADPRDERSGRNHFYIDALSGEIHVNADRSASASDAPLGN